MSLMLMRSARGRSAVVGRTARGFLPAACKPPLLSARAHPLAVVALHRPQSTTATGAGGDRAAASFANASDVESTGPRGTPTSPMLPPSPPSSPPSPSQPDTSTSTAFSSLSSTPSSAAPRPCRPVDYSRRVDTAGKDVLTCCRLDHRLFDWLYFDRFRPNVDGDRLLLQETAYNLVKLLSLHFFCEEYAVYPTVTREAPNGRQLVQELVKDHFLLRGALYKLDELMTAEDNGFCSYVCWMCDRHVQHAEKEEQEVDCSSQSVLSWLEAHKTPAELLELGRWYNVARNTGPTRPHLELSHRLPMDAPERQLAAQQDAQKDRQRFQQHEAEGGGQQNRPPTAS